MTSSSPGRRHFPSTFAAAIAAVGFIHLEGVAVRLCADVGQSGLVQTSPRSSFPCSYVRVVCRCDEARRRAPPLNGSYLYFSNSASAFSCVTSAKSSSPASMQGAAISQAPRHSANSSVSLPSAVVSPGRHASLVAHVFQQFVGPAKRAGNRTANPSSHFAVRLVLLEVAVEAQRVLHLRRSESEDIRNFDDGLQRHVAQPIVDDMQRRQRHRLLRWDTRGKNALISAIISSIDNARSSCSTIGLVDHFVGRCREPSVDMPRLAIQLRGDDVQTSQHGHDVAQRMPANQVREHGKVNVRRRPATGAIGDVAAIADEVETEFAVRRFDRRVDSSCGTSKPRFVITNSKCVNRPFDRLIHLLLGRQRRPLADADVDRPGRECSRSPAR